MKKTILTFMTIFVMATTAKAAFLVPGGSTGDFQYRKNQYSIGGVPILNFDGTDLTMSGLMNVTGTMDFTGVILVPGADTLPLPCTNRQLGVDTNATSGQRLYVCENGTWVQQGGSGSGSTECSTSSCDLNAATTKGGAAIQTGAEDDQPDSDAEVPDNITVNPINATTEAAIEAVVDLQDLQGAVTDAQVPDDITVSVDISDDTNLTAGTGITISGDTISVQDIYESSTSNDFDPDRLAGDSTDDNLVDSSIVEQHVGTDISADLEEETHASEHSADAADEILMENLGTACLAGQVSKSNGDGTVSCAPDNTGGGGTGTNIDVQDGGAQVVNTGTMDFDGDQFAITDCGGEGCVAINDIYLLTAGDTMTGTLNLTGVATLNVSSFTASRALISGTGKDIETSSVTSTELGYVSGVTSAIQTQIDGKQAADADLTTYAGITPSANVQSLLGAANYAAMRALLDVEAGTDYYSISAADAAFQPLDADLTDLADGSLTGSKVGSGIDDDNVSFDDANSDWTATTIGAALEEMIDEINSGTPNSSTAKVHWSQLTGVPAGFADNTDDGAGGGSPGGSDTYVQFNDGGSSFGGDSGLTYNKTTDSLTVGGSLTVDTSTLFVDGANNRVGIGTSAPSNGLDVDVDASFGSTIYVGNQQRVYFDGGADTYISNIGGEDSFRVTTGDGAVFQIANNGLVGIGITAPQAILDIEANDSALRVTRLADPSSDISSPLNGMIAYDSTDDELQAYVGGSWKNLAATSSGGGGSCWEIDGSGDLQPISGSCSDTLWEIDGSGDLQPKT